MLLLGLQAGHLQAVSGQVQELLLLLLGLQAGHLQAVSEPVKEMVLLLLGLQAGHLRAASGRCHRSQSRTSLLSLPHPVCQDHDAGHEAVLEFALLLLQSPGLLQTFWQFSA